MLETDKQRRWWFANHPEYSSNRTGAKQPPGPKNDRQDDSVSPHEVDEYVDYALKHVDGPLAAFLQSIKRNFGTEGQIAAPTMLAGGVFTPADTIWGPSKFMGGGGLGGRGGIRGSRGAIRKGGSGASRGGSSSSRGGSGRGRGGPAKTKQSSASGDEGPGKWVEVKRGDKGLEHQSKMSGQPIIRREDGQYIREYEVNGVKFDDYRDGKLYEYKGRQGNLKNKEGLFPEWADLRKEAQKQAERQQNAAGGMPIIWRVGTDQVRAFQEAIGHAPGIKIVP